MSRDRILDWTRGRGAEPYDRTVDITVYRLRRKLEQEGPANRLITTVRSGGSLLLTVWIGLVAVFYRANGLDHSVTRPTPERGSS